jgi:signal transduction histidine kinase
LRNLEVATRSLRFRLLAGALVWLACALAGAGVILADLFEEHVRGRVEAELETHLDQLTALLETGPDGRPQLTAEPSDPRFRRPLSGLYWQAEVAGIEPLRSRSLWDQALSLPPDALQDGEIHRHDLVPGPAEPRLVVLERFVVLPGEAGTRVRLAVAADARLVEEPAAVFARMLALSLAVLGLALLVAAVVQVEVGLRPLARLRQELAAVRGGQRKRFATEAVPIEVEPLAEDLNLLLEHSEAVLARARVQAGNLAHALKADLTVLANEVRELTSANVAEAVPRLETRLGRMRRQVDHHMARARAAAARGVPGVSTDVAAVAAGLARTLERLHAERVLAIEVDVQDRLRFGGEREDLQEMLGNLMDNACKWARRRVRVTGHVEGHGSLLLAVEDDGPGLPAELRQALPAPGVRLDESVPGTGLGLAVVRDLVELYGGTLRLEQATELGGLRAELRLPAVRS